MRNGTYIWFPGTTHVWLGKNSLCADEDTVDIHNEEDCKRAADEAGYNFHKLTTPFHPKGCFLNVGVVFNNHTVGRREMHSASICRESKFHHPQILIIEYNKFNVKY